MYTSVGAGLGNRTFAHRTFLLFENVQMCDRTFFRSLKMCNRTFFALWKCANLRSHILLLFKNVRMCYSTFFRSLKKFEKSVIAQSLYWNEQMCENVRKKCKIRTFSNIRSFRKSDCAIALFATLWKCANVQSHILLLFKNVQMWDRTFLALWKCVKKCASTHSLFRKSECANFQIALFSHKKRAIVHFQNVRLPNPVLVWMGKGGSTEVYMTEDDVGVVGVYMCPLFLTAATFSELAMQDYSHGV